MEWELWLSWWSVCLCDALGYISSTTERRHMLVILGLGWWKQEEKDL